VKINKFEDIAAWQKAKQMTIELYGLFQDNRDYSFRDQIQRASVSVMNNIAEGFERSGDKEFKKFLYIAKGSAAEVRSMLYLARELSYINEENYLKLLNNSIEIAKIISGLIKSLK